MSTSTPDLTQKGQSPQPRPPELDPRLDPGQVRAFVESLLSEDVHAKRVLSLSYGVVGVLHASSVSIHAIGQGLAVARGLEPKHAVKQVDRLLSNAGIDVWGAFAHWVPYVLGERKSAMVAIDWTEFDGDDHVTVAIHLITNHGRATPLIWLTIRKSELEGRRNECEDRVLGRLVETAPEGVELTVLADRAFGDQKLFVGLQQSGLRYIIRFRGVIRVEDAMGEAKRADAWVPNHGRARMITNARITQDRTEIPAVVCVRAKKMKDAWCLATNRTDLAAREVVASYGRRFTIEESFRDSKDLRFGLGLSATHIGSTERRDRLLLLVTIAQSLLTLLGAAGERIGIDRYLKVNTSKKRAHSLFRQGSYWYSALGTMKEDRFEKLMIAFGEVVREQAIFSKLFGVL